MNGAVQRRALGPRIGLDWATACSLFGATVCIVIWQNSRSVVLWDLSYILDSAARIASGQTPYRDFPFAHAPLTFLIQAGLINLAGRAYWVHVAYCALVGGISTVVAWRIVLNLLGDSFQSARAFAFLLCLPLAVLGVYSIFPQPFYDPDCIAAILISLLLLQGIDADPSSTARALAAGVSVLVPVFIKQNIGLAFLLATVVVLGLLASVEHLKGRPARPYLLCLAGVAGASIFALVVIQITAGLDNYWHWTMAFAASRRLPALREMLGIYSGQDLPAWLALFGLAVITLKLNNGRRRVLDLIGGAAISAPFVWAAAAVWFDSDDAEPSDQLLAVWPFVLIVALLAIATPKRRPPDLNLGVPLIVVAAIQGALMSQQLWGSTYAIWPLLSILLASVLVWLSRYTNCTLWMPISATALMSSSLLLAGGAYVAAQVRLNYAQIDQGALYRPTIPSLQGMTLRGAQLPDFEELLAFARANIPNDDGIVLIPGEDPFYFATGRRPQFPVLLFDHSTNPFSVDELMRLCLDRRIRWLIVKRELQLRGDPVEHREQLMSALRRVYAPVARLRNYDIYQLHPQRREAR